MRADIYITNTSDKPMAVGMTVVMTGKTSKISQKDFERKGSYIDRMIKEGKLSFANPNVKSEASAPAIDTNTTDSAPSSEPVVDKETDVPAGEDKSDPVSTTEDNEAQPSEADASYATDEESTTPEPAKEEEETQEVAPEPEVSKDVPAPNKTAAKRKK